MAPASDLPPESFLHRLPVMTGLDDAALEFLGGLARREDYAAGATIVAEGELGNRMFFVREGRVRVVKAAGTAQAVVLAELGPSDFFGELSLVECVARSASVVTLGPTTVYTLRGTDFYQLYHRRPDQYGVVMLNLARDLARRLRQLDERLCGVSH